MADNGGPATAAGGEVMASLDRLRVARTSFRHRAWSDAHASLAAADVDAGLAPEDLELLATAAYLTGRQPECEDAWARAHQGFVDRGEAQRAARCAFWLGMVLFNRGEEARGSGWIARADRLLENVATPCVERGYLLVAAALARLGGGDAAGAHELFSRAADMAAQFDEADLGVLGRLGCGQALIAMGDTRMGVRLLDEAMVAVELDEVSTVVAGIVYCAVILACQEIFDVRRAQQWTAALSDWCARQPDLVPYRGQCLVHRSELLQLHGDWHAAMDEVRRARERLSTPPGQPAVGMACYQQAELHRLRGEYGDAEEMYTQASAAGHSPQPGLALLRMAQGRPADARGAIRRVVGEARDVVGRAKVLHACVEIMIASGDRAAARDAAEELAAIADRLDAPLLHAEAAESRGAVLLAEDDARGAAPVLQRAIAIWEELEAPCPAARARVLLAIACRAMGDEDTARLEADAARRVLDAVGAHPDVARLDQEFPRSRTGPAGGLTARELDVVRLVAAGRTNREIADVLVISEKTVARHLSNVFTKLGLANRAAATAYAYEHGLL